MVTAESSGDGFLAVYLHGGLSPRRRNGDSTNHLADPVCGFLVLACCRYCFSCHGSTTAVDRSQAALAHHFRGARLCALDEDVQHLSLCRRAGGVGTVGPDGAPAS